MQEFFALADWTAVTVAVGLIGIGWTLASLMSSETGSHDGH